MMTSRHWNVYRPSGPCQEGESTITTARLPHWSDIICCWRKSVFFLSFYDRV